MAELTLWKKQEIDKMREELEQLFRKFRRDFGLPRSLVGAAEFFTMDFSESENTLTIKAKFPGLQPEDIQVSVTEDILTFKGEISEKTTEEGQNYQRIQTSSRSFARSITLPCRVLTDEVTATYEENTLKIVLPKCKPREARGVTITVK
jgi:HSP20 family protein